MSWLSALQNVGSGIYDKNLGSANDFSAPVPIGSARPTQFDSGAGIGPYLGRTSGVYDGWANVNTRQVAPPQFNFENTGALLSAASGAGSQGASISNNNLSAFANDLQNARNNVNQNAQLFGESTAEFLANWKAERDKKKEGENKT